jgi:glycosyltransferase involved in cell wall biosynthesis
MKEVIKPGDPRPEIWIYGNSGHGGDKRQFQDLAPWSAPELAPVTVIIPTIAPRIHLLNRALKSVQVQDLMPQRIIVQVDHQGEGAAITRNKALQKVPEDSKAVMFLDDDDYFLRWHTRLHWAAMLDQQADYVYAHWMMGGLTFDPFPSWWRTTPWSNDRPHQTTIVTMVKRELAQKVGFRPVEPGKWPAATEEGHTFGEDYQFTLECLAEGAKVYHILNERTWVWVATGNSTQGLARNWKVEENDEPRFWVEQRG